MANLFKSLKPHADLGKSGFDLSQKHVFSSKSGQLLPCLSLETVPDDHFEIDMASLSRTMTMNTSAFLRGKFRYDFFFVPYSQLWHPFNQFVDQREDVHSVTQKGFVHCPVVSLGKLLRFLYKWGKTNVVKFEDIYGFNILDNGVRLLDLLGYGNHIYLCDLRDSGEETDDLIAAQYCSELDEKYVNVFRLAAYQHIWYDYYRNKYYDEEQYSLTLDGLPDSDNFIKFIYGFNFDDITCDSFASSVIPSFDVSWDGTESEAMRIFTMCSLRYAQWKKDLFTSAMPGTQFGAVSTVDLSVTGTVPVNGSVQLSGTTSNDAGRWVSTNGSSMPSNVSVHTSADGTSLAAGTGDSWVKHTHTISGSATLSSSGTISAQSAFDVLALKRAEALQAWKQNTLRAGNMVDSNFEAHFGVKPHYEGDNNVAFLGSFEAILSVNTVTATSTTGQSVNGKVGDLAGTGVASAKGEKIVFDAKDFGVIQCICSFVPEAEYNSIMLDKANKLCEQFDFFTPEYQNVGLEAVDMSDLNLMAAASVVGGDVPILGYSPRYWMYKQAYDKVHGEFATMSWTFPSGGSLTEINREGSLRAWVSPRKDYFDSDYKRLLPSWYVSPKVLDSVFGVEANSKQNTDTFLHDVYFDIKAIRPMSVLGLPQF